jgi:hypothetical protein
VNVPPIEDTAPWWATGADHPDPGVTEYHRSVGSVASGESREELRVDLVQREDEGRRDAVLLAVGGMRFSPIEVAALVRTLRRALVVMDVTGRR